MKTTLRSLCLTLAGFAALPLTAQTPAPPVTPAERVIPDTAPPPPEAAEMKKLGFMIGTWKGDSWIAMGPQRRTSAVTENVQSRQNGRLLLIEGIGKRKADRPEDQVVVHDALGIIFYDAAAKRYAFHAYREGAFIDSELKPIADRKFEWGFREPRSGGHIRFTIDLTVPNRWLETGEFTSDEKTFQKFFEMTLTRTP